VEIVGGVIKDVVVCGVVVWMIYDVGYCNLILVFFLLELDVEFIVLFGVFYCLIVGIFDFMYYKYVVCDGEIVWIGLMNWMDDLWLW